MGTPRRQDVRHTRGDTWLRAITLEDALVADVAELWFTVRDKWPAAGETDVSAITQVKLSDGAFIPIDDKSYACRVEAAATTLWVNVSYVYDVQAKLLDGSDFTIVWGVINIDNQATLSL